MSVRAVNGVESRLSAVREHPPRGVNNRFSDLIIQLSGVNTIDVNDNSPMFSACTLTLSASSVRVSFMFRLRMFTPDDVVHHSVVAAVIRPVARRARRISILFIN